MKTLEERIAVGICGDCKYYERGNSWSGVCSADGILMTSPGMSCQYEPSKFVAPSITVKDDIPDFFFVDLTTGIFTEATSDGTPGRRYTVSPDCVWTQLKDHAAKGE